MQTSIKRALRLGASAAVVTALSAAGSVAAAAPGSPGPSTTTTTTSPPAPASTTPTTRPPTSPATVETVRQPVPNQYIVTLKGVAPGNVPTEADGLARKHGGAVFAEYQHALTGFAVRMNAAQAAELAREPNVASVQEDGVVHASTTESPSPSWGIDRIDHRTLPLDNAYVYGGTGSGVHAYIIDTGIRINHPDFGTRASFGADKVTGSTQPPGTDCYGHGTHVAGTLGGTSYGVAKGVSLVEVRVLDCTGSGTTTDVVAGIDWVTANAIKPAVANMSLGGGPDLALDTAVTNSVNAGITYAIAAGNETSNACGFSPARTGGTNGPALTAAASDINDSQASFSNFGACVDLYAPGDNIVSDGSGGAICTYPTCTLSGTSMATPHVAGTAALYLGAHPLSTPATVKSVLTGDATPNVIAGATAGTPNRLDYTGPGAPAPFTASPGASNVQLSWTAPPDGGSPITNYKVYRGTSSGTETLLFTTPNGSTTSYTDSSFSCNGTAFYQVAAVTVVDEGTRSAERQAGPSGLAPCAPTLTATAASHVVHLTWVSSPSDGSITNYKIYRGTSSGAETLINTVSGSTTSYDDTGLTNTTPYYYQVSAVNGVNEGTRSTERTGTPTAAVWAFVLGTDNGVWGQQHQSGGAWSGWQPLGGCRNSNIATTSTSSNVSIFTRGCDNALWYRQYNGAWLPWQSLGGGINSNPATATDASGTWVFVRATDNAIWYQHFTGGSWAPGWQTLGGGAIGSPSAIVDSTGVVWVFTRGTDGALWDRHFSGGSWSGWQSHGGSVISDAGPVTGSSGTFVFVVGSDRAVYEQQLTGGSWSGWQYLGGCSYSNSITTASTPSGFSIFALGCDSSLWYRQYNGGWSGWQPLGGSINANPATVSDSSESWAVVRATDYALWFQHFTGGSWASGWQTLGGAVISDPALLVG